MKRRFVWLALLILAFGCSKGDSFDANDIAGTWHLAALLEYSCSIPGGTFTTEETLPDRAVEAIDGETIKMSWIGGTFSKTQRLVDADGGFDFPVTLGPTSLNYRCRADGAVVTATYNELYHFDSDGMNGSVSMGHTINAGACGSCRAEKSTPMTKTSSGRFVLGVGEFGGAVAEGTGWVVRTQITGVDLEAR